MNCPYCGSGRVRKASVVYESGTRDSTSRTVGSMIGFGVGGRRRARAGIGLFQSRSVGRSSSIAAQKADKARIVWWGPTEGVGLFIILSIVFLVGQASNPFGLALYCVIGVMICCPLITGIAALIANKDYDHRWYCGSCGQTWTPQLSISDQQDVDNSTVALRELRQVADRALKAQQIAKPRPGQPKLSWIFLPPDVQNKKVRVQAECSCGQVIQYDDDWTDNAEVICVKCGGHHGTYADYKTQAREAVDDFISGNTSKYRIKS